MIFLSSPHQHSGNSIQLTMLSVIIALLPASMVSVYLFGWLAALLITFCISACLLTEYICLKVMQQNMKRLWDGSAALTGLLLALVLPASVPWWMALFACVFAILITKQLYGGLGHNLFNPALAARVVLLISFPLHMTVWIIPMPAEGVLDLYNFSLCFTFFFFGPEAIQQTWDAITMASPLGYVKTELSRGVPVHEALNTYQYSTLNAFIGREAGSLGETSALALLIGGIWLIARRTISWHIPLSYLCTVALLALVFNAINPDLYAPPLFHLLAGGLMLCAFFMATDPVSSPSSSIGKIVFGVGCGVLTWVIRTYGNYPEGAMFAVILMNCAVPLIDYYFRPRVYGKTRKKG
ncbi:MAG: RnfABCDGE type electron transport complex subunit D [Mariprofundaceae bacterium]|nr:RnfABCDGE type electron transport complex subunit D [Mariprofundaceae bacterium]